MTKTRFTQWVVLACIGTVAACTSGDDGAAGNTELNVIVPTNAGTPSAIDIQQIEYTITCLGNDDVFLDNAASFPDQVRIDGNLEVVDGRTSFGAGSACNGGDNNGATCYPNRCTGGDNPGAPCNTVAAPSLECQGTSPVADGSCDPSPNSTECPGASPVPDGVCETVADTGASPGNQPLPGNRSEIWQGFMDLPPGGCNVQLRARDADGEVICTSDEPFVITADVTTKVNVLLMCRTSFQAPVGSLDLDSTFSFNVGNFCPDLFVFNATTSDPLQVTDVGIGIPAAATTLQVRYRDGDSTCGNNCDPQVCVPTAAGLSCTPGDDDGVSTTITCSSEPPNSFQIDCFSATPSGNGGFGNSPDSCTIAAGDQLGALPEFFNGVIPGTPIACADDDDCATALGAPLVPGFPDSCQSNVCDYSAFSVLLNASMGIAFFPPRGPPLFGPSGAVITCTATTTDGDVDCDKQKELTLTGPGDSPCDTLCGVGNADDCAACDDTVAPDPGNAGSGIGQCTGQVCTGDAVCSNPPVANGTICTDAATPSGNGLCTNGVCVSADCNATGCPDDGNECTNPQACNTTSGFCEPDPPTNVADGTSCDNGNGNCQSASGDPATGDSLCIDNCAGNACIDPGGENDCTQNLCDPAGGPPGTCSNPPEPAGTTCTITNPDDGACDGAGTCVVTVDYPLQSVPISIACTNSVTSDISVLPFDLSIDPEPLAAGSTFDAAMTGGGVFSEAFLDVAQGVVPCGTQAGQVLDLAATVSVRSGATGGDADGNDVVLGPDFAALDNRCGNIGNPCPNGDSDCIAFPGNECSPGFADVPNIPGIPGSLNGCGENLAGGSCIIPPNTVPDCDCSDCAALDPVGCIPFDVNDPCTKEDQCKKNGFCITGPLPIPLSSATGTYTADSTSGTPMSFGWFDGNPVATNADGTCDVPPFNAALEPLGLNVSASGLVITLRCIMCVDSGGPDGISTCQDGSFPGDPCLSRALTPSLDNFCASGDRVGQPCDAGASEPDEPCPNADCAGFACACENNTCGLLADGVTAAQCRPLDRGSPTPDSALNTFLVP